MALAVSPNNLTAYTRSLRTFHWRYVMDKCDTVKGFCFSISVPPCQYHSVHELNSSYSNVGRNRKTNGQGLGTFRKQCPFRN
jgi:hypothetical protein